MLSLDLPTFGIAGKSVRMPFTIESTLAREHVTTVDAPSSNGDEVTKEVRIAPMGRTSDWMIWKPKATGDYTLTLDVPPSPTKLLAENNRLSAPISIREEKLRVLRGRIGIRAGNIATCGTPSARSGSRAFVPAVSSRA